MESNKELQKAISSMTEEEARFVVEKGFNPSEISNFERFKDFIEAREKPILGDGKIRVASDGRTLNLGCLKHTFRKKMEGLDEKEQKKFWVLWDLYFRTLGTMNRAKQMAFRYGDTRDPEGKAYSLLGHRRVELIELFGRFFSVTEVLDVVVNDWGMTCSRMTLNRFAQTHNDEIEEKKEWYKRNYSDVRLGYKRSRLDELTQLYNTMKSKFKDGKGETTAKTLLDILKQVKAEVEGDLDIRVSGSLDMNIEHTINVHIRHQLMKSFNLTSLIISRVAIRLGLNPIIIMNQLQRSYYSKFTTLNGNENPEPVEHMTLPSVDAYDFKQIEEAQVVYEERDKTEMREVMRDEEDLKRAAMNTDFKKNLLEMLGEKVGELEVEKKHIKIISSNIQARQLDHEETELEKAGGLKKSTEKGFPERVGRPPLKNNKLLNLKKKKC